MEVQVAEQHGSVIEAIGGSGNGKPADPEVPEKATRRKFSAEYRNRILNEVNRCASPGEIGALLRREGLYASYLVTWRRERENQTLTSKKRGRDGASREALAKQNKQLKRKNDRLEKKLKRAELIIDFQKKLSEILEIPIPPMPEETEDA